MFLHFLRQNDLKNQEKSGNIPGKNGKYFLRNYETQEFRNFGNLRCKIFAVLKFRIPEILIIKNDEFLKIMKSRRRGMS